MTRPEGASLRIAVWHNLPSGGGKRALYDQVRGLLELGHHVESWCPPTADQSFLPLGELVAEHVVDLFPARRGKQTTAREIMSDHHGDVVAMDEHCARCARDIDAGGFDVLFANSCMSFRVTSVGRQTTLPAVLYLQEPYRWLYEAMPTPPWAADVRNRRWWTRPTQVRAAMGRSVVMRRRSVQVREEVRNAAAFDSILCNSLFSRESILRAYGLDSRVCYLGVDDRFLANPRPASRRAPFFLTVGAVTTEKNVEHIIRALALRSDRSWPLVWVANMADARLSDRLHNLASNLGVRLELRTGVGEDELHALLQSASLFLYAPRLEPFGLAPLEAAACGLPTIAVAEAGVRETIVHGSTGILVPSDLASFAAAIDDLVADPARRDRLGRHAVERVRSHWTLTQSIARLEHELRAVTGVVG